ncbi:MAG: Alkaline phosphatase, partial [Verrucomicrobiales bacterium]|nr:Alkaline phosphatase [Verrucomicrobiales bacterium]
IGNYNDNTITIHLSFDDGTFAQKATYPVAGHPVSVRSADLNGDGYDDLVIAYADTNMVSVMLSTGSHGTNFAGGIGYITSASPNSGISAIFLTDLNGDSRQDLIVANSVDNTVNVLFGTSAAGFSSPVTYSVGAKPMWIHVADMNGDNRQDIITANYTSGTISILPGQSGGTFGSAQTITLFPGGNPQPIRVVTPDVNRDGRLDLAVVNYASNTLSILLQQSNGTYAMTDNYDVGTHPSDFFLRDLDGNGISDMAVLNSGSGTVDLFFNNGTGSYDIGGTVAVGPGPVSMFGGKFSSAFNMNALVVADGVSSNMSVLFYSGPVAESATVNVSENRSASVVLGAHNNFFPQIYDYTVTQNPTNGTISGTPPFLTYTPDADFIGTDHLKFTAAAGDVESATATITFTVQTVNHQPTFTMSTNYIAQLQGTSFTLKNFITSKNAGAPTESAQKIDYIVTNIDTTLFATVPKIATNGTLTFKLAPLARGTNDVTVYAHDSGGTARGGTNLSVGRILRIVALRVDHAPVVKMAPSVTLLEDSSTNITITVTDIDDPMENISVTPVSLNESIVPTANVVVSGPVDTNFSITITPAPDANGTATIQLLVSDGQDTTVATLRVNITAIDDQPSFDILNPEVLALEDSTTVTVSNFCTSISAGPANEISQGLTFVIGGTNPAAFTVPPSIDKYGTLKFRPALAYVGTNNFSVYLKDSGTTANAGVNVSDTNLFSIAITTNDFRHITGTYNGLFSEDSGVAHTSSGFVTFSLGYTRTFSGRMMIAGGTYPLSGKFDTNGAAQVTVKRTGKSNLTANLQVDLLGDSDEVTGDVTDGNWDATVLGDRVPTTAPAGMAGKYNIAFIGDGDGVINMGGDAIGAVTLTSANRLSLSGSLPDRTTLLQTIAISKNGQWPLYVPLYAGAGSMIGWVTVVTNDPQPLQAQPAGVSLIKTANNRGYYPVGTTNLFSIESSTNAPFRFGVPVVSTNGTITWSSGNLFGDDIALYRMSTNNVFSADGSAYKFKLTFDKSAGYANGTFFNPGNATTSTMKGILLPSLNEVRGYFYTPTQTGEFFLQGN